MNKTYHETQRLLDLALHSEPGIPDLEVTELFGERAQVLWGLAVRLWAAGA